MFSASKVCSYIYIQQVITLNTNLIYVLQLTKKKSTLKFPSQSLYKISSASKLDVLLPNLYVIHMPSLFTT
jgi:hypothetical protein